MVTEKVLVKIQIKTSTLVFNLKRQTTSFISNRKRTLVESQRVYHPVKPLKFYLQLFLLRYKVLLYHCKFQQNLFEAVLILSIIQIHLKCLHSKIIYIRQPIINFVFRLMQRYHFHKLSELKEEFVGIINSLITISNSKIVNLQRINQIDEMMKPLCRVQSSPLFLHCQDHLLVF